MHTSPGRCGMMRSRELGSTATGRRTGMAKRPAEFARPVPTGLEGALPVAGLLRQGTASLHERSLPESYLVELCQMPEAELTWEQSVREGIRARRRSDESLWTIGDLARTVEARYGERSLKRFADAISVDYERLREARWVASCYDGQNAVRTAQVSWSHHRVVAARDDRGKWLERAAREGWTKQRLTEEVRRAKATHVWVTQPTVVAPRRLVALVRLSPVASDPIAELERLEADGALPPSFFTEVKATPALRAHLDHVREICQIADQSERQLVAMRWVQHYRSLSVVAPPGVAKATHPANTRRSKRPLQLERPLPSTQGTASGRLNMRWDVAVDAVEEQLRKLSPSDLVGAESALRLRAESFRDRLSCYLDDLDEALERG